MADIDFKVNVDIETTGKTEVDNLEKQIEKLKNSSIKLNVDLSGNGSDITKYFSNIEKLAQSAGKGIGRNFGQLISSSAEQAISNVSSTGINKYFKVSASDSNAFRKEMDKLVSSWTNGKGKLTDIKIQTRTSYDKDADENIERLHQAQVTYNNELGETIKKTIAWRRIGTTQNAKGEDIPLRGFVEVSSQYSKSLDIAKSKTDNFVKQQKQAASNLKNTVNQISTNALDKNASKAIKNDANRQAIENQVNTVRQAITELENADSSTFTDAQIKVKDEISNLKILVKEMQNAESTATALRSKPIDVVKDETLKKVKGLEADIKKAGVTSTDLETYVTQMNNALKKPIDASGINDVLNIYAKARAELGSLKKEASADSSLEKAKIKADGLISEINKASADNSGLSSWKTTINGVETSVNSLVSELGNVKNAGDVSVISEKWKTFSKEAKSAGVIASETGISLGKIQENFSTGKYSANSSIYESQLSKYIGKNSDALSQMRKDASEYMDIQDQLSKHFDGSQILDDNTLIQLGNRMETLQKQMKNNWTQITKDATLNSSMAFDKEMNNIVQKFQDNQDKLKNLKSTVSKDSSLLGSSGYDKITSQINQAEQAIQRLNTELAKGNNANLDNLTSDLKEVNSLTKKATTEYEKLSSKASSIDQQSFINKLNKYAKANPRAIKAGQAQWNEMFNSAQSASMTAGQLKDAELNLKQFDNEMQAAGKTGKNFFDEFKRGFIKIGEFAYTYGAIQGVFNNISSSINELKDINTIVTEISKAADVPVKQLKDLETNSFSVASKYGQKASDYLLGVQEMTRAGYSNTSGMAELSTLAQSAGDMTAELANQYLIASDMAYGYGGNVEKLNALLDSQNQINKMVC